MSVLKYNNNGTWEGLNIDHASTADSALYDADGNVISSTYLPRSAGTVNPITGNLIIDSDGSQSIFHKNTQGYTARTGMSAEGTYYATRINDAGDAVLNGMVATPGGVTIVYGDTSGEVRLHPNGYSSTAGAMHFNKNGTTELYTASGTLTGRIDNYTDNIYYSSISNGNRVAGVCCGVTTQHAILYANGQTVYLRPNGATNSSKQVTINATSGCIFAQGVYDTTGSGSAVIIQSDGQMRRTSSLRKYKKNIEDVTEEDAIKGYELRPITFKSAIKDDINRTQYGLIAEEVQEVLPNLGTYDKEGNIDGVAYDRVCAILLKQNQMLKARVDALEKEVKELKNV